MLSDFFLNVWAFLLAFLQNVSSKCAKILLLSFLSFHSFLEDIFRSFLCDAEEVHLAASSKLWLFVISSVGTIPVSCCVSTVSRATDSVCLL